MRLADGIYSGLAVAHSPSGTGPITDPTYTIRVKLKHGETADIPGLRAYPFHWNEIGVDEIPSAVTAKKKPFPVLVIAGAVYPVFTPPPAVGCEP